MFFVSKLNEALNAPLTLLDPITASSRSSVSEKQCRKYPRSCLFVQVKTLNLVQILIDLSQNRGSHEIHGKWENRSSRQISLWKKD